MRILPLAVAAMAVQATTIPIIKPDGEGGIFADPPAGDQRCYKRTLMGRSVEWCQRQDGPPQAPPPRRLPSQERR